MNRDQSIEVLNSNTIHWDVVIIGGGATGLGIALDASLRGYKTLLLEQADFTKGTSSRSTKLVHGGVRYLAQGDYKLVIEALRERGLLLKNAPHITSNQTFVIPSYSFFKGLYYTTGLKAYDLLAGKLSLGKSGYISSEEVSKLLPGIETAGLKNGIVYHDGQFDDSRLGINLAQSCVDNGGHVINYMKVTGFEKNKAGKINKVHATDLESGRMYEITAKQVINATGVFVDEILSLDNKNHEQTVQPSQGTHIVLDRSFFPAEYALMIPETSDGRVLFAIPWYGKVVVGTTDVLVNEALMEPVAREEEVDFILKTFGRYMTRKPERKDILSVFAGLRPLAKSKGEKKKTKEISRNHKIILSKSNLITITGGKWTTYREMAEEAIDLAIKCGTVKPSACRTKEFKIHGYTLEYSNDHLKGYGSDAEFIKKLIQQDISLGEKLHPAYPFQKAQVVWAVKEEMARTIEDVLARRLRILFLDANAAISMVEEVARIMAEWLYKDHSWQEDQIRKFRKIAEGYQIKN